MPGGSSAAPIDAEPAATASTVVKIQVALLFNVTISSSVRGLPRSVSFLDGGARLGHCWSPPPERHDVAASEREPDTLVENAESGRVAWAGAKAGRRGRLFAYVAASSGLSSRATSNFSAMA